MTSWNEGYVAEIGYTFGYYQEMNPLNARFFLAVSGITPPSLVGAACELGFGQGLSINMHAAGGDTSWFGNDFNPAQAGFAQELATASGAQVCLSDQSFSELSKDGITPEFDFIALHGVYSWVSVENRKAIVDLITKRLKVGGVVYLSYNTLPGWATNAPLRHLMSQHSQRQVGKGVAVGNKVTSALQVVEKVLDSTPAYAAHNPSVRAKFDEIKVKNSSYLAHEYFNEDWAPLYFSEIEEQLAPAKLQFACSAHPLDLVDPINLSSEQQAILAEISDPVFRQTIRDFMVNQQFRKDYWVKGSRPLSPLERKEELIKTRFIMVRNREKVSMKVSGALGDADLSPTIYGPILDILESHQPTSLEGLHDATRNKGISFEQLLQAAIVLIGIGAIQIAKPHKPSQEQKLKSAKLNTAIAMKSRATTDITYLSSPITGGGIPVGRFEQLFMLAERAGAKTTSEIAKFAWSEVSILGQKLIKDGKTLERDEENLKELESQAEAFKRLRLPLVKALMIDLV